jgi:hypothetical protein
MNCCKRAKKLIPGREDLDLDAAGIYLRKRDLAGARRILTPIAKRSASQDLRFQAERMLQEIESFEQQQALLQAARERRAEEADASLPNSDADHDEPPRIRRHISKAENSEKLSPVLPKLQVRGNKLAGVLVGIDCPKRGVFFVIKEWAKILSILCTRTREGVVVRRQTEPDGDDGNDLRAATADSGSHHVSALGTSITQQPRRGPRYSIRRTVNATNEGWSGVQPCVLRKCYYTIVNEWSTSPFLTTPTMRNALTFIF